MAMSPILTRSTVEVYNGDEPKTDKINNGGQQWLKPKIDKIDGGC
jgi:hypothetical protein